MLLLLLFSVSYGQQKAEVNAERRPPLQFSTCTKSAGCTTNEQSVVLDANWRWVHGIQGYTNCYDGDSWNSKFCPDSDSCIKNCALDGAGDYEKVYGVSSDGSTLKLGFKTGNN